MKARTAIITRAFRPNSIQARTEKLQQALTDAATLPNDLQVQLKASTEALTRIRQQAEDYEKLAALNQPIADAVGRQLGKQTAVEIAKGNRVSLVTGIVLFLLGSGVTLLATMFSGALTLH